MGRRVAVEGLIAGTIGAATVAVWFLVYDAAAGQPFRTPALLAAALFQGLRDTGALRITPGLVLAYSAVHWAAFMLFGLAAAALFHAAEREPDLMVGLFILFCCFDVLVLGLIAVLAQWLLGTLAWWAVLGANLSATVGMLGFFFHRRRVARRQRLSVSR
jgi:hypothetical protein